MQAVLQVLEKPLPLAEYVDTVLEVWTQGAIAQAAKKPRASRSGGAR
jgi:hypothetical protein